MKFIFFKALAGLVMCLSCNYSFAAITHYENTDTNSILYGSYNFDDVLKKFSNIALKSNFSRLQGPTAVDIEPDTLRGLSYADGSRDDTYYIFQSGLGFFEELPGSPLVIELSRWEVAIFGGIIEYVSAINDPDFGAEFVYFSAKPSNVTSVPEPDTLILLLLSPFVLFTRHRKQ